MNRILFPCLLLICIYAYAQDKIDIYDEETINTKLNLDHINSPDSMRYMNAFIHECLNKRDDEKLSQFLSVAAGKINDTLWRDYTKIAMNDPTQQKTNDFRKNNLAAITQLEGILNILAAARLAGQSAAINFEKKLQEEVSRSDDLTIKAYEDWWEFYLNSVYKNIFHNTYVDFIARKYQHSILLENSSQILHLLKQFNSKNSYPDDDLMLLRLWVRNFKNYAGLDKELSNEIIQEIEDNYLKYGSSLNEYHREFLELSTVILCKIASEERVEMFRKEMAQSAKEKRNVPVEYMVNRNWDNLVKSNTAK